MTLGIMFLVIFIALTFEYINGFHDTANSIATIVGTKVLTPRQAIAMASITNLIGALAGHAVAKTVSSGLVDAQFISPMVIICALLGGIVWNLLDNAAKAMPNGGTITVRASRGPGPDRATLEVQDEGIGIEPWRLSSIFEPAASTTSNSYAPTHGLGLWWTKGQVESFGGTIEVSSEPGKGTRFRLIFRAT